MMTNTTQITPNELRAQWQAVRDEFKLNGHKLTPEETAGMLIEELGSALAALRLVMVHQDAPIIIELRKPRLAGSEVRDLLVRAWLTESGEELPTVDDLQSAFDTCLDRDHPESITYPKAVAGGILKASPNLREAINNLGMGLYSNFHYCAGPAAHPLAREALFWLDMAALGETHPDN